MKAKDYKGIEDYVKKRSEQKKQPLKGTIICLAKGCDNYLYKNQSPCDSRYWVDCFQKGENMLKAIYFALHFAMLILGTIMAIHIDLWLGLAIAITFGVKFFFMLPNNKEGF